MEQSGEDDVRSDAWSAAVGVRITVLNQESDAVATPKQAVRRIFPRVLAVYATN
jgi:hypothetical protein